MGNIAFCGTDNHFKISPLSLFVPILMPSSPLQMSAEQDTEHSRCQSVSHVHTLPYDCRMRILCSLEAKEIVAVSQVCRSLYWDCQDPAVLRQVPIVLRFLNPQDLRRSLRLLGVHGQEDLRHGTPGVSRFSKLRLEQSNRYEQWLDDLSTVRSRSMFERRGRLVGRNITLINELEVLPRKKSSLSLYERSVRVNIPNIKSIVIREHVGEQTSVFFDEAWKPGGFYGCPATLTKIVWPNCQDRLLITGKELALCENLTELYLDNSTFFLHTPTGMGEITSPLNENVQETHGRSRSAAENRTLLDECNSRLEKISLLNAKYSNGRREQFRLPQIALIKFVRNTPTLKWFRSDLSPSNLDILRHERPEIEFVSNAIISVNN